MRRRTLRPALLACLLLAAPALAGCAGDEDAPAVARVEPPAGTSWATCPPSASLPVMLQLQAEASALARDEGLHRLDPQRFLWVWRNFTDDLHEDRISRVNPVEAARDAEGVLHLCTRADVSVPLEVDPEPRTYAVGLLVTALEELPPGPVQVTVNWVAGCACDPLPRGNDTARFDP